MPFDKCLKLSKFAKNIFKCKYSKKPSTNKNESENDSKLIKPIKNNSSDIQYNPKANYDLLILNSSCNCQNNLSLYKCAHDLKGLFDINNNISYEHINSFSQHPSNMLINNISFNSDESENNNCSYCNQSELSEIEYLDFINTFCNHSSLNNPDKSLNDSLLSLPISNSTSFSSSSNNSEFSLDLLLNKMESQTEKHSCINKQNCCCFMNKREFGNDKRAYSNYEEEINIEINHCLFIIKELNLIKLSQDDDNLLTRVYVCITDYQPLFDDDLPVSFAETVLVLQNRGESDDWLFVRSTKTGQTGYIPRYITMDLDVFLQHVRIHCNKLIKKLYY